MLQSTDRIALFMEGALGEHHGKLGYGVLRYSPQNVVCVLDSRYSGQTVRQVYPAKEREGQETPIVGSVAEALALGANILVLGIAPGGGKLPLEWLGALDDAVRLGMSLVNGLHQPLKPRYSDLKDGQFVWDIRQEPEGLVPGEGKAAGLTCKRLLMVGTDMAVGKMTAGLEITREAKKRGIKASFIATGQIGILITGAGIPLDAIRVDYASGAVEAEVLKRKDEELLVVEGQGALCHPGSTSPLPLMRGSCPTHFVLCHRAGMKTLRQYAHIPIPDLGELADLYQRMASVCGTFPTPKFAGVCLDTSLLEEAEAKAYAEELKRTLGVPVCDPIRWGTARIVDALM